MAGKKAVILCNGPSLNKVDFSLLKDTYTFGLNQLFYMFDSNDFRPSCMVMADVVAMEKGKDFLNQTDLPVFIGHKAIEKVKPKPNITFLHEVRTKKFARDISVSFYGGYTVTFVALQLAYHLGFQRVTLVGCDHSYYRRGKDRFQTFDSEKENIGAHYFHPKYFQGIRSFSPPSPNEVEYSYGMALDVYEANGREVYNSTEGGNLEVFPRIPLQDFLSLP